MFKLLFLPFKLVRLGVKLAGVRNSLLILVGVGLGFLLAPERGAVTRARLQARLRDATGGTDPVPADADLSL